MINVMKMRLFPFYAKQISIPANESSFYNIIFFSENQNFLESYAALNIRRQFVKKITYIPSKMPRLMVLMKNLLVYRKRLGLLPVVDESTDGNIFIDTTPFMNRLDSLYQKGSYRRPIVSSKIISYLNSCKGFGGRKDILMYHVNLSKEVPEQFMNRRSFILAMIAKIGDGSFPFNNVVLAIEKSGSVRFFSMYNKNTKSLTASKVFSILKSLYPKEKDIIEPETQQLLPDIVLSDPEKHAEKQSILNAIDKYRKSKVITS